MRFPLLLASVVCAGALLVTPTPVRAVPAPSALYALSSPPSHFEWGCFGPCACPVFNQSPLQGTFVLTRTTVDPLFEHYDVSDVRWKAPGTTAGTVVTITGSGTYRRGGEVALTEELTLDLAFNGGPVQHFDSGLRPVNATFPEIRTEASLHFMQACFDSVLVVDAQPAAALTSVDGSSRTPSLAVGPNPSSGPAAAVFTLPHDTFVDLGVYDLSGRSVRALARHEWLTAGTHVLGWDGLRSDGAMAAPGLYLVRLETGDARVTRTAVRVNGSR